jgi:two-component system sensor histidine kinase AlgZ
VHPILAARARLGLYLAAWAPIAALLTAILARGDEYGWIEAAAVAFPVCAVYAFICLAAWYLCRTLPSSESALARLIGTYGAAAIVSSGLWLLLGQAWVSFLGMFTYFAGAAGRYASQSAILFVAGVLLFLLAVTVHHLLIMFEESRKTEKRALEMQILAREAELKALRAQIDPHFLFNSLHSVSALTTSDPAAARKMCLLLADFLRGCLKLGAEERIPLHEEIRLAEHYLDIERVRLGPRLSIQRDIDPECEGCLVPPLLIQPLVENAVKHGVAPMLDGGSIAIRAMRVGASLVIRLENSFDPEGVRRDGAGVGLQNVRMRLLNMFNGSARLDVNEDVTENAGRFRVELRLPCGS